MYLKTIVACLLAFGLLACKNDNSQESNGTAPENAGSPAESQVAGEGSSAPPPAVANALEQARQELAVPDLSVLGFSDAGAGFGFDFDKANWSALPDNQLPALSEFTSSYSKRTPAFKMVGGLVLKKNAGKALQLPVVTIGVEPLDREAPSLESIRMQSGGRFLTEASLAEALPAHLESTQFPRPLVDPRRQAFYATSFGSLPSGEEIQVMQAIFIRPEKFIFLQMTCPRAERQRYARDFGAMADSLREKE